MSGPRFRQERGEPRSSEGLEIRKLADDHRDILMAVAETLHDGGASTEATLLFLFDVESRWRPLVEQLRSGVDWAEFIKESRAAGVDGRVMACGWSPRRNLVDLLAVHEIDITPVLRDPPVGPGAFWVVVGCDTGLALVQIVTPGFGKSPKASSIPPGLLN